MSDDVPNLPQENLDPPSEAPRPVLVAIAVVGMLAILAELYVGVTASMMPARPSSAVATAPQQPVPPAPTLPVQPTPAG